MRKTNLYYLQSRYYNPDMGRFINADMYIGTANSVMDFPTYNLFAYCNNNPLGYVDETGEAANDWSMRTEKGPIKIKQKIIYQYMRFGSSAFYSVPINFVIIHERDEIIYRAYERWIHPLDVDQYYSHKDSTSGDGNFGGARKGRTHAAVDMKAPKDTPIYAMTNGIIKHVSYNFSKQKKPEHRDHAITVKNDDGTWIRYGEITVAAHIKVGRYVKKGEKIGVIKETSYGNMLHLEVYAGYYLENGKKFTVESPYLSQNRKKGKYYWVPQSYYDRREDLVDSTFAHTLKTRNGKTYKKVSANVYRRN